MFKKKRNKKKLTSSNEELFGHPPGTFLFVKNEFIDSFTEKISNSETEDIFTARTIKTSFLEVSGIKGVSKCDFSEEEFKEGDQITKFWVFEKKIEQ